ncbi:HD domain-containing phosphohydrolase [Endothiovibrio diazotrophicus]
MNPFPSSRVLIVDDTPKNIQLVASILEPAGYDLSYALDGEEALTLAERDPFELILLDVMMPGMDGFQLCRRLKSRPGINLTTPVIFLTAHTESDRVADAFSVGGVDYISKPFNDTELLSRVTTHIRLKSYEDHLQRIIETKLTEIDHLSREIEETQREVIFTLGAVSETRSHETGLHVKRVAEYSRLLGELAGLDGALVERIKSASPMHDIGKVGIPDRILHKPGRLTDEEWTIMQTHARLGHEMLRHSNRPILKCAAVIALEHHERWDGDGYPCGLRGEEISIEGRVTAIADVFDALSHDRCYKPAWPMERVVNHFHEGRGQHFDPRLADLFLAHVERFIEIRETFRDQLPTPSCMLPN